MSGQCDHSGIRSRWTQIHERICEACERAGRDPQGITLVAITKGRSAPEIARAARAGFADFGENRAREFREKHALLEDIGLRLRWHFVGRLQPSSARLLVGTCALIHSVHDVEVAAALDASSRDRGLLTPVLLQINTSGEDSKAGVSPDEAVDLLGEVEDMPGLRVDGLMTMAPEFEDPEETRPVFRSLADLRKTLCDHATTGLPILSMGMTNDFEVAIEEGATMLRVGRALFE